MTAQDVIERLALAPHPEGGHYRETFRDVGQGLERGVLTAIYFLLGAGERSRWHRVDAVEVWVHCGGAALALDLWPGQGSVQQHRLGSVLGAGEAPQAVVPAGTWQSAASLGAWSLVTCAVAPAFEFAGLQLAAPGWEPPVAADEA